MNLPLSRRHSWRSAEWTQRRPWFRCLVASVISSQKTRAIPKPLSEEENYSCKIWSLETASDFADFDLDGVAIAFAALGEPFAERRSKARGIDAQTGFELALAGGQGLVKLARAREIPHAKAVQPIERARTTLATDDYIHVKLSRKHRVQSIALRREQLRRPPTDAPSAP